MAQQAPVYWGTGRRKTAVARVRVLAGNGDVHVNRRNLDEYFSRPVLSMIVNQPFEVTKSRGKFDVFASVSGGGIAAQAEAVRLGIARALDRANEEWHSPLKRAGYLTRDSRAVEPKKYGRHKARKRPQYSKR